jgi:hypothetical protein
MHAWFSKLPIIVEDLVRDKGGFYNCAIPLSSSTVMLSGSNNVEWQPCHEATLHGALQPPSSPVPLTQ